MIRQCLLISVIFIIGCNTEEVQQPKQPTLVDTFTITSVEHSENEIEFPAVISAADRTDLSFRKAGEVSVINVKPGDIVKKGDLLAQLEPTDFNLAVQQAQAKFNVADSQFRRSAPLVKKGLLAQSQFDELSAQREMAKVILENAKLQLSFTQLKAPFDGMISRVPVEQFESIQVGQEILDMHRIDRVEIDIQLSDLVFARNRIENRPDNFKIGLRTAAGRQYQATYLEHTTEPDPDSGAYVLSFSMPMPTPPLLDGMAVDLLVNGEMIKVFQSQGVNIPIEAVFNLDGDSSDAAQKYVWLLKESHVYKQRVSIGKVTPSGVRILTGLAVGDTIVTTGVNRLDDQMEVKIKQEASQ
ncbi:efflux RND transporter periplasmic adaptor subunit [Vibrio sp. SS-MA-C1-2]|uniref:efflux RND transporter periplasmic adaptor subunit n=1 Tax=Vibrio sp. SS-MA-C1-2 TaxID=2908646 RepID=UPI001F38B9B8|nr:efflux RND transporter periplasmic adaptor subunit [Vibrio sp. SS-MA-C1-2]UJF17585.1 efflux RND transporter periplasmic adaptor subunit [Vibrio sp. SS-MA-C1-2]